MMEFPKQNREFINSLDKRLFWDVNIKDVDEERLKRFLIQRVIERGELGDIRNAVKHYGMSVLTREAQQFRSLDPANPVNPAKPASFFARFPQDLWKDGVERDHKSRHHVGADGAAR